MWWWILLAVLVAALALLYPRLKRAARDAALQQEAERRREEDRAAARRLLEAGELPRLVKEEPPARFEAQPGETLYLELPAVRVAVHQGEGRELGRGRLLLTDRRFLFLAEEAAADLEIPIRDIQRVDSVFVDTLEITYMQNAATYTFDSVTFQVGRPLALAAYLSRLAGFQIDFG